MENIFDYIFAIFGVSTSNVDHPIVITEPPSNPHYNRNLMSELLFECYGIPSLAYGIDSLFSYYQNVGGNDDGLVVSAGHSTTHIIPMVQGKGILSRSKRMSYGGTQSTDYMLKLMQLKYPTFPTKMTSSQAQQLVHDHVYVSANYQQTLKEIENRDSFPTFDRLIQFPFVAPVIEEKSEEELRLQAAKKEEASRRLREAAAKTRLEKLMTRERELEAFTNLKSAKTVLKKAVWLAQLKETGFTDEADLDDTIKQVEAAIQKARNKELGIDDSEEKEPPATNLIDIPDDQLDENDKKEKRKQRLLKASYDARQRAKQAKEEAKAQEAEEARLEEAARLRDPAKWAAGVKDKRHKAIDRIKKRKRLAAELSDRKSRASQLRMRSIANLADDNGSPKRRRKGQEEDTFGADDSDWMIYREISRDDDDEEEEEDLALVNHYESLLLQHDPTFLPEHSFEATSSPTNTLMHQLTYGVYPLFDPNDAAQHHQMHLNVERVRVSEVLFQPSIVGLDQAGLIETMDDIVKTFDVNARSAIQQNVFLTGGFAQLPGLTERMQTNIQTISPVGSSVRVRLAQDPVLDAWRGAAKFALSSMLAKFAVTKAQYQEFGGEYIKEHGYGNVFRP
ncbi:actin-like ATPase domain-containing protein [Hesseltinella vesiculosa]|uniref:Actin-like ATPase domain-containing protein n=1 Tax=Hesseltinella vesiculosa TaxID=101127 RepID=A0A1X2G550_9FUNG|nr:actin-like ATPase domain-containing protein [Hesseltinella vesiculosa]